VESGALLGGPGCRHSQAFRPRETEVKGWVRGDGLYCLAARRTSPAPGSPRTHRTSPRPLLGPTEGSRANEEVGSGGRKPSRAQCLRQDCPILTQEDALTADKRSPIARYLHFQNAWELTKDLLTEVPDLILTPRLSLRDSGSPEGVKKFAQLGPGRGEGGSAPPAAGGGRAPGAPSAECARARAGGGRPGSAGPRGVLCSPRPLPAANAGYRGPGDPRERMRCSGRGRPRSGQPRRGRQPHVGPLAPDAERLVAAPVGPATRGGTRRWGSLT
jgi:hypothetical protein